MPVSAWSTTAADNDDADAASGIIWTEGQLANTVNDSARAEMAEIKKWYDNVPRLDADNTFTGVNLFAVGSVIQSQRAVYRTYTVIGSTLTIPVDDTIPQISEGSAVTSVSITPKSAASTLRVTAQVPVGSTLGSTQNIVAAIFRDATANAIEASFVQLNSANGVSYDHVILAVDVPASATTATTFYLRAGASSGSCYVNGGGSNRWFGGVSSAWIKVEEIRG